MAEEINARHSAEAEAIVQRLGTRRPDNGLEDKKYAAAVAPIAEALSLAEDLGVEDKATPLLIERLVKSGEDLTEKILGIAEAGSDLSKTKAALYRASLKKAKK
jgi:hypothetical protein